MEVCSVDKWTCQHSSYVSWPRTRLWSLPSSGCHRGVLLEAQTPWGRPPSLTPAASYVEVWPLLSYLGEIPCNHSRLATCQTAPTCTHYLFIHFCMSSFIPLLSLYCKSQQVMSYWKSEHYNGIVWMTVQCHVLMCALLWLYCDYVLCVAIWKDNYSYSGVLGLRLIQSPIFGRFSIFCLSWASEGYSVSAPGMLATTYS